LHSPPYGMDQSGDTENGRASRLQVPREPRHSVHSASDASQRSLRGSTRSEADDVSVSAASDDERIPLPVRVISEHFNVEPVFLWRLALGLVAVLVIYLVILLCFFRGGLQPGECGATPCPQEWVTGETGGYYCADIQGCRPAGQGQFPICQSQCWIGKVPSKTIGHGVQAQPTITVAKPGYYDLRMMKDGEAVACSAPISKLPGDPRYGCSGQYGTAKTCDAAPHPIRETQYVAAVHKGCATQDGKGTYGYAYDDGVGLKQCPPMTLYEWILCPSQAVTSIRWTATSGLHGSQKRFRITNHCPRTIWVQSTGTKMPYDADIVKISPGESYVYSIPRRGLPSTRFLPKVGCDEDGANCAVQSVPPCPPQGCSPPVDTKFEASFGCTFQAERPKDCASTGQGVSSTYQDWWDGSAVDGWTLPFDILTFDGGWSLQPGVKGSSSQCMDVLCANLTVDTLCPRKEWLTPTDQIVT